MVWSTSCGARRLIRAICRRGDWHIDGGSRASANHAVDADPSARLLGKTTNHTHAETRAIARFLCGEEWLEYARQNIGRHAYPGVLYCDGRKLSDWRVMLPERGF